MEQKRIIKISIVVLACTLVVFFLLLAVRESLRAPTTSPHSPSHVKKETVQRNKLEEHIYQRMIGIGIPSDNIKSQLIPDQEIKEIKISVPQGRPMEEIIQVLLSATKKTSYTMQDAYYREKSGRTKITFESTRKNEEDILYLLSRGKDYFKNTASLSLIISNLGELSSAEQVALRNFPGILNYHLQVWDSSFTADAELFDRMDAPIVLQLPMESRFSKTLKTPYTIRIDDSPRDIENKMTALMHQAPQASGISTYGGDLILESEKVTRSLVKALEKRKLLFFDLRKSATSTIYKITEERDVPYYRGNNTLTGESTSDLVIQLKRFASRALNQQDLVVWAEASPELTKALRECIPYFDERGVTLTGIQNLR